MPFTVSHVAAVLPLQARPRWADALPAAVLALAAMAPDLPTAVGLPDLRSTTHALWSALTVDPLLVLGLTVMWVQLVRPAVADVLPGLAARWSGPPSRPASGPASGRAVRAVRWYLAAVVGSLTHVLWDVVTHAGTGVARWSVLTGYQWLFPLLQFGSSLLGLAVLGWWCARWWRASTPRHPPVHTVRWGHAAVALVVAVIVSGAVAAARYAARAAAPVASAGEGEPLVEAVFGALSGLLLSALVLSLVHRLATARRPA